MKKKILFSALLGITLFNSFSISKINALQNSNDTVQSTTQKTGEIVKYNAKNIQKTISDIFAISAISDANAEE